ncbi:MAG: MlaD family protein [Bacteroidota bacterium]
MSKRTFRWSELTVGLILIFAFAIFLIAMILVGSNIKLFTPTYSLRMFVPNIEGLVDGSMVTLAGRKVGFVKDVRFVLMDGLNGVEVEISIDTKFQSQITDQSKATIKTIGLLGDKYVDITMGQAGERVLVEGEHVGVKLSPDIAEISRKVASAIDDFVEMVRHTKSITQKIDEGKGVLGKLVNSEEMSAALDRFVTSVSRITTLVESKNGTAGRLLRDSTLYVDLSAVAENLNEITTNIRSGEGSLGRIVTDPALYEGLSRFASQADALLSKMNNSGGSAEKFLTDPQMYEEFVQLTKVLNTLVEDFKEHPGRYFHFSVF